MSITPTPSFSHFPITTYDVNNLDEITGNDKLYLSDQNILKIHLIFLNQTNAAVNIDIKEKKRLFATKEFKQTNPITITIEVNRNKGIKGRLSLSPIGTCNGKFVFQKETELHITAESQSCTPCISSILLECTSKDSENTAFSVALRKDTLPWSKPKAEYISATLIEKK